MELDYENEYKTIISTFFLEVNAKAVGRRWGAGKNTQKRGGKTSAFQPVEKVQ